MFDEVIKEVKALLEAKQAVTIIDVREKWEYDEGHIPTAINVPLSQLYTITNDLDELIYVYCRTGIRAYGAKRKLDAMGYTNVINLGGYIQWNDYKDE